jgi:hypothetical protein
MELQFNVYRWRRKVKTAVLTGSFGMDCGAGFGKVRVI